MHVVSTNDDENFTSNNELLVSLMEQNNWSVEELAEAIGDSPLRIYRVLEGDELLGKAASLAALAVHKDLQPVKK